MVQQVRLVQSLLGTVMKMMITSDPDLILRLSQKDLKLDIHTFILISRITINSQPISHRTEMNL